jgi:hypothetical protein
MIRAACPAEEKRRPRERTKAGTKAIACEEEKNRLSGEGMDRPLIAEGGRSGDLTPRDNLEGTTGQMAHYAAYTTTIMGAHSVPRWYEAHWSQDWTWRALAG